MNNYKSIGFGIYIDYHSESLVIHGRTIDEIIWRSKVITDKNKVKIFQECKIELERLHSDYLVKYNGIIKIINDSIELIGD